MKYRLPYVDTLRKEARSLRKELQQRTGNKLSISETEKLIAHCLGFRDANEHQKDFSNPALKSYGLMHWRNMDQRFVERLNKEFPGIGDLSLKVVQTALTLSKTSWRSNQPLTALEMCLLIEPPECKRGPIGIILDNEIVIDQQLALNYFIQLAGINDKPKQHLISVIDELYNLCSERGIDTEIQNNMGGRGEALELFHVLSKDMPVWQLKNRFRSLINHHRSLYFALDSLPIKNPDNPVSAHPEAAPLLYAWRHHRVSRRCDWIQFLSEFSKKVSSDSQESVRTGLSAEVTLENEGELMTSDGFLEGHSFNKRAFGFREWSSHRYPIDDSHWDQNTCLIGCVGSGMTRALMAYLYPVLMRGQGALIVSADGGMELYWVFQAMMMAMGRPNDVVVISSSYGQDDPWCKGALPTLRDALCQNYESKLEREMANTLIDLLNRNDLLKLPKDCEQKRQVILTDFFNSHISSWDETQKTHWQKLCVRFCHEHGISHQLWGEVLNQWVVDLSGRISSFISSNSLSVYSPEIDWENAINQGKLVICLESALEKLPGQINPVISKVINEYMSTTKKLGARGYLISDSFCEGFELSEQQTKRVMEPDFTWICRAREISEVERLLRSSSDTQGVFKRLVLHPHGNGNNTLSQTLRILSRHPVDLKKITLGNHWGAGKVGPNPGHYALIEDGVVFDFRVTYVSFLGDNDLLLKRSRLIPV